MPEDTEFKEIDLINPETVFVNRLPDMMVVQERLFRHFKTRLFQEIRRNVQSTKDMFEISSHDEYLGHRDGCNLYGVLNIQPIKGFSLMTIEGSLLAALVDDLFGANAPPADGAPQPAEMSIMEKRIGRRLIDIMINSIDVAFRQYFTASTSVVRTEGFAALASVGDAGEPFCVMSAELTMPTGAGAISIAIPYRGMEPFREILGSPLGGLTHQDASSLWSSHVETAIDIVPIEIGFEIGAISISTSQLETLAVGDVLPLTFHRNARAMINQATLAEIAYGSVNSNYGVCFSK